ncbi:hypothetical protein ES705_49527 [subsurface metagenome]
MAIETLLLDPLAVPYTDDEIVGKVNAAAINISRAGSVEAAARPIAEGEVGTTELEHESFLAAEKAKLEGVEAGAKDDQSGAEIKSAYEAEENAFTDVKNTKLNGVEENAKDDQTGAEIRDAVVAIPDTERKIIVTNPISGQYKVTAVQVTADDKIAVSKDSEPIP